MKDIFAQLNWVDKKIKELEREYLNSLSNKSVSSEAKILTHEIIEKLSNILDQLAFKLWEKYIAPNLSKRDREKSKKLIYFPATKDVNSFKSIIGKWCKDTSSLNNDLYRFLEDLQPYKLNDEWLLNLRELARQKHIGLIPQKNN